MEAHGRGDAAGAHAAFLRAAGHAERAGAVVEEATYRTGLAAAAVDAGMVREALESSMRASLLWENLGQTRQWSYALLARASAFSLIGARFEARAEAHRARLRASEANDARAEAYAWLVLADVADSSREALEAAQSGAACARKGCPDDDLLRVAARILSSDRSIPDDDVRHWDQVAAKEGTTASRCEWWGARAKAWVGGLRSGRSRELISHVARLARAGAPVGSRGPMLHAARRLAEQEGDGDAVRLFATELGQLAVWVMSHTPAELRDSLADVAWVQGAVSGGAASGGDDRTASES